MAIAFTDTFDRADGPLGGDWIVDTGTPTIVSNKANFDAQNWAHPSIAPLTADATQRVLITTPTSFSKTINLRFRAKLDGTEWYGVSFNIAATSVMVTVQRRVANVTSTVSSVSLNFTWPGSIDLMATVVGARVYAWVQGWLAIAVTDPYISSAGYLQLGSLSNSMLLEQYDFYDLLSDGGNTIVDLPANEDGSYTVHLYNPGADWTAGTPGAPSFTASNGTVSAQTIESADEATITYMPPTIAELTTIYDPQNDWNFRLALATDLEGVGSGGGGGGLTEAQAETIEKLDSFVEAYRALIPINQSVWHDLEGAAWWLISTYDPETPGAFGDLLRAILSETNGIAAIYNLVLATHDALDDLTDSGDLTLNQIQNNIRGTNLPSIATAIAAIEALPDPTTALTTITNILWEIRTVAHSYTLESVMDAIAAIEGGDNTEVLNAIAAVRGSGAPDLAAILTAIAGLPQTDYSATLTDIHGDVAAIPTDPIRSLTPVTDAIDDHDDHLTTATAAILAAIALIPTDPAHDVIEDLDAITSAIAAITSAIAAITSIVQSLNQPKQLARAPVWPGLANVTMGDPVALATGVTVTGPMDGVVVELSTVPSDTEHYDFDEQLSYVHIGAAAFANDDGAIEGFQPFSFGKHLLTPTRIARASSCYLRCALGVGGTVTPWTINAA